MKRTTPHPIEALGAKVSLSRPGDEGYARATHIWARPSGRDPVAVAHCRTAADVSQAVRGARVLDLPLSVRGGGHDWAGRALCPGLVIDLSPMRSVTIEEDGRVMRMGGGTLAGDVFGPADAMGGAVVTGTVGTVGMAGLTLGGGYGALIGRFGLALDNLLSAQVVLADGTIVVADERSLSELFWALRGGGGNFGVVTEMRHRLHALPSVRAGMILYPFEQAAAVLGACSDFLATAPDELTVQLGLMSGPTGQPVVLVAPTWSGAPEEGEGKLAPLTRLGTPLLVALETRPPGAANSLFDAYVQNGQRVAIETRSVPHLDAGSIDALVAAVAVRPSPGCSVFTHELRGAASRVPAGATAFGLRREHVLIELVATCDAEPEGEAGAGAVAHRTWAEAASRALLPFALPGGYPNLLADADPERIRASYGPNAHRLAQAKRRFDPDNVFASAIPVPRERLRVES